MPRPVVLGSYELLDRIGEGGMAEVWRARARGAAGFEKIVVIKRVLPALMEKPGFADLLVREAKISARLSHPNIAQVFGFGDDGGGYYIAMEYVHGRDLGQAMSFRGGATEGLSLSLRIWIMSEVAKALEHAHSRRGDDQRPMQIVHRDVSPQNVLLGYEGEVKVADFGIARADEQGLGRGEDPTILRGKYAYMSPEQARGETLDRRSDVFAAGVVLFELLSGQRLFRGKTSSETLSLVRAGTMPLLDEVKVEDGLEPILRRCLAVDREGRYATAGELYRDLAAWLFGRGEPVGEPQLSAAMARMFPPEAESLANKLRVDLMRRAMEDATSISAAGAALPPQTDGDDRTAALPISRKGRVEERRLSFLALPYRDADESAFVEACDGAGAQIFRTLEGLRIAAFGYGSGLEEPSGHAARAALELRRICRIEAAPGLDPVPPMVLVEGEGRVLEGVVLEPEDAIVERAKLELQTTQPGEIRLAPAVVEELGSAFRVVKDTEGRAELEGFRARHERDAAAMRKLPLVGRTPELRQLSEALARALSGDAGVLHLVGEAGVGKSRLVAELRALAAPREVAFLLGTASEPDRESRHAILADLVRDLCGIESDDVPQERYAKIERLRVLGLSAREVRVLGELVGLSYPTAILERVGRPRGVEVTVAIRRALVALAHDRAVVVILENAHWMDDASRQLVPLLCRGLRRSRVLVIVTSRPGLGMPAIAATPMRVLPLGHDATARLVATVLGMREAPGEVARRVVVETAGNPQWIPLVVPEAMRAHAEGNPDIVVPPALARAIEGRVESLDPIERAILQTVSAYDGPIPVELLFAIEGTIGEDGLRAVERLLARCLLAPAPGVPAPVDFTLVYPVGRWGGHSSADLPASVVVPAGVVRRVALGELSEVDLSRLHERVVLALERSSEPIEARVEKLAYHSLRTNDRRRAPDYLIAAADHAERGGAPTKAAETLASAARVLREDGDQSDAARAQALALRGLDLALLASDGQLSAKLLAEVRATIALAPGPEGVARQAEAEARVALGRDDPKTALTAIAAVRDDGDVPAPALGRLRLVEGRALVVAGHLPEASRALERAVAALAKAGDTLLEGRALALLSDVQARGGATSAARASVARVMALAARHADPHVRYESLAALGAALEAEGDALGAMERFREALEVATGTGLYAETSTIGLRAAVAALRAHREAEAGARASAVVDIARRRRLEVAGLLAGAIQSAVAATAYPDGAYAASIERAADKLAALGRPLELAVCLEMLGRAHAAASEGEAAATAFARAGSVADEAGWTALSASLARYAASIRA